MLTYKEILKLHEYDIEHKVYCKNPKCKAGFGVIFKHSDADRYICKNCGHWIYRDKKTQLKYEMKERGILKWK